MEQEEKLYLLDRKQQQKIANLLSVDETAWFIELPDHPYLPVKVLQAGGKVIGLISLQQAMEL